MLPDLIKDLRDFNSTISFLKESGSNSYSTVELPGFECPDFPIESEVLLEYCRKEKGILIQRIRLKAAAIGITEIDELIEGTEK